jgi:hypothetical protein
MKNLDKLDLGLTTLPKTFNILKTKKLVCTANLENAE